MIHTLGRITVAAAGTPVNALAQAHVNGTDSGINTNISDTSAQEVYSFTVQAWHANTGRIWVGNGTVMNLTTGANVLLFLPSAAGSVALTIKRGMTGGRGLIDLRARWVDAEISGDSVLVSYLRVG